MNNEFAYYPEIVNDAIGVSSKVTVRAETIEQSLQTIQTLLGQLKKYSVDINLSPDLIKDMHDIESRVKSLNIQQKTLIELEMELEELDLRKSMQKRQFIKNLVAKINSGELDAKGYITLSMKFSEKLYDIIKTTDSRSDINIYDYFVKVGSPYEMFSNKNLFNINDNENNALAQSKIADFMQQINFEMFAYLVDNNLMYDGKKGVSAVVDMYNGIFGLLGCNLAYDFVEWPTEAALKQRPDNLLMYLGEYVEGYNYITQLHEIDCVNYIDLIFRNVGIGITEYDCVNKWQLCSPTAKHVNLGPESQYFHEGNEGDILARPEKNGVQHIIRIHSRDENGYYYTAEEGREYGLRYGYKTFDELEAEGYRITSTETIFDNTGQRSTLVATEEQPELFTTPDVIMRRMEGTFKDAHIDDVRRTELESKLEEQYNARNGRNK